jgi:HSP20 family protein
MFLTRCPQPAHHHFGHHHAAARRAHLANRMHQQQRRAPPTSLVPPASRINEHEDRVELSIDVPGVKASDVSVNVENRVLTISGSRTVQDGNRSNALKFSRQFALDATVDAERLSANLVDGVLTITAPKIEKPGPVQVTVTEEAVATMEDVDEDVKAITANETTEEEPEIAVVAQTVADEDDDLVIVETADENDMDEEDAMIA